MATLCSLIQKKNTARKLKIILPYFNRLRKEEKILDFGCGDLSLASALKEKRPQLQITGVDVVDFGKRPKDISFVRYDGKVLPFSDSSFDTVLSFHVLHHCKDPEQAFKECLRVTKRRMLLIEPVARYSIEILGMKFMDWLFNVWKSESIPLTFQFLTYNRWKSVFAKYNLHVRSKKDVEILPKFFPTGRSYLFELYCQ